MKLFYRFLLLTFFPCFLPAAFAAPHILTTIKPLHALISGVTEGVVEPALLLEKNSSPHSYSLRPHDISKLENADIIFMIGHDLELFLEKPLKNSKATIVEVMELEGIHHLPLRKEAHFEAASEDEHHHREGKDPHIWLDPQNAIVIVTKAAELLAEKDKENAVRYHENAKHMIAEIMQLDKELDKMLFPYRAVPYLVSHDAYHYFEQHYHLNGIAAITLTPDQNPGAKTITQLRHMATEQKAFCLFSEPQFPERIIHLIADETGLGTALLDAEWGAQEGDTGKSAYFTLMRGIATNMVNCFKEKQKS